MRKAGLALTLVGIAALATVLWRLEIERAGSAVGEPAEDAPPVREQGAELVPDAASREQARVLAQEPVATTGPEDDPGQEGAGGTSLGLAGTIVVLDELGIEHAAESGRIGLYLFSGSQASLLEIDVDAGRWSAVMPAEPAVEGLGLGNARLGGRPAAFDRERGRFPVPTDRWLALRARWPPPSILHVRDRTSGRELDPVLLTEVESWPESGASHPGTAAARARDMGPSPVALSSSDPLTRRTYYARSPGYAWGRIDIEEWKGGERLLLLDAAGDLEVVPVGHVNDAGARLRVYGAGSDPAFDAPLSTEMQLVEDLAPGIYHVRAEIGEYWRRPLELGDETVELAPGQRARVVLQLREVTASVAVPLAGTLEIPAGWTLGDFMLDFRLLDAPLDDGAELFSIERADMEAMGDPPTRFRWSTTGVQPGRYEVELDELAYSVALEVGPDGEQDALIEIPPPAELRVLCTDADTGLGAQGVEVTWHSRAPGASTWSAVTCRWDDASGGYVSRAPLGEIVLGVSGNCYEWKHETVVIRPGLNELRFVLARLAGLKVRLREGTIDVRWSDDLSLPELTPAEGQQDFRASIIAGGQVTMWKKEAGLYRLEIPEIPGFCRVPVASVRLVKGESTEHVVELRRAP